MTPRPKLKSKNALPQPDQSENIHKQESIRQYGNNVLDGPRLKGNPAKRKIDSGHPSSQNTKKG